MISQVRNTFNTVWAISKMEARNILAYRFVFWSKFIGMTIAQFFTAYFLWSSIYNTSESQLIKGMSFEQMMFYYILAPMSFKVIAGLLMRIASADIYEGGLNKYLLYPYSYFSFKLITQLTHSIFFIITMFVGIIFYYLVMGSIPYELSLINTLQFCCILLLGSVLYFYLILITELIAFWADNVWSFAVLLRWCVWFFGGVLVPLSLFPEWAKELNSFLPFSYLVSFPIDVLLGNIGPYEMFQSLGLMISWIFILYLLARILWIWGNKKYSGIGI